MGVVELDPAKQFAWCATYVWSIDPDDQRAVGEMLHRLSVVVPARTAKFVRRYCRFMCEACLERAISAFDPDLADELRANWRRATSI